MQLTDAQLKRCRDDIAYFAETIVDVDLWEHQLEFMENKSKFVVVVSARQIGKSTACAIKAIHTAFSKQSKVLVVSPSLRQSGLMFTTIRQYIGESDYLRGSLVDDTKTYIRLSNGSELWCLPDSPAQIRGFSKVQTVIIDEANFCSQELLRAINYSIATIPDSQLFMISSPWSTDHWFYRFYQDGLSKTNSNISSFHYTYSVSPLIQKEYIDTLQDKITEEEYKTEILGEWVSDEDAYFDYELVNQVITDYKFISPDSVSSPPFVWCGVDWAARGRDETVIMFISKIPVLDFDGNPTDDSTYIIPYFESFKRVNYSEVIQRLVELSKKFRILKIVSEMNGIGDMPTQSLEGYGLNVQGLFTTAQIKVNGYGRMKILMQGNRLLIPREPELIKQLTNLRYRLSESGASYSIGHSKQYQRDDYTDALMFAILACEEAAYNNKPIEDISNTKYFLRTKGIVIPEESQIYSESEVRSHWQNVFDFDPTEPITAGLLDKDF